MDTLDSEFTRLNLNRTDELIKNEMDKLVLEKQKLVIQRVKELAGVDIDFESEKKRVFPRIAVKHYVNHAEQWYWNDGSANGLLLISFYPDDDNFKVGNSANTIKIGFKYKYDI